MMRSLRPTGLLFAILSASGCLHGRLGLSAADPLSAEEALFASQKYGAVIETLGGERIAQLPRKARARAYDLLGLSLQSTGDSSRALQIFELAEGLYPKDLNILTDMAYLLHSSDLDERARPYFERVLNIHPNNARSNLGLAEVFHRQGNLSSSAEHYERALREWNMHAFIWRDYARVLFKQGKAAQALATVNKALSLEKEPDSLLLLASIERRLGMPAESYADLDSAAARAPSRTDLPLQKALWLLEDGRLADAKSAASAVLKGSPDDVLAHWIRGSVALRLGRTKEATAELAAAATRDGTLVSRTAKAMLEALP